MVDRQPQNPLALSVKAARLGALAVMVGIAVFAWPVARGYLDGRDAAPDLATRADAVIAAGRGIDGLAPGQWDILLSVEDPGFADHGGYDFDTAGGGITTLTQSLAKRTGFEDFQPGWAKLRQTGLAMGYEAGMTKDQIAALWLDTVEMGRIGGEWRTGLWSAAEARFGRAPAALDRDEFLDLVGRMIAPAALGDDPDALAERTARIRRLLAGACAPEGNGDVWLEGCA
ncbi:MAG: transglycosylase domain-containing protein [Pseudomonadota bacterium]